MIAVAQTGALAGVVVKPSTMAERRLFGTDGVRGVAGFFVLLSLALGYWVSPWWYLFTAFVGANLLQSAFSGTCPMFWLLKKVGMPVSRTAVTPRSSA